MATATPQWICANDETESLPTRLARHITQHWKCKALGHYAPECPHQETSANVELLQVNETGTSEMINDDMSIAGDNGNYALSFSQLRTAGPPFSLPPQTDLRSSFIMDSGSSIHSFTNSDFLTNIRTAPDPITSFTNGGTTTYSLIGTFAGVLDVWFHPDGLTNIISLARHGSGQAPNE